MLLQYHKLHEETITPVRSNPSDVGLDIFFCPAPGKPKELELRPQSSILLGTGLKFGVPHGYMLEVKNRSSVASKRQLLVGACVIDPGYDGEVYVNLHNVGSRPRRVKAGDKIAQIVMVPVVHFRPVEIVDDALYDSDICISNRGSGGFGSTGG